MTSLRVSEFNLAAALVGDELVGIVQGAENVQTTTAGIITLTEPMFQALGAPAIMHGLVSGGQVAWESGLIFRVSASEYYIDGTLETSAEQTVTLGVADATNPRIDVIALDATGPIVIAGVAAATPIKPSVDPLSQIELTFITIAASGAAPSGGVTIENVYLENTEWATSTSGVGWNAASLVNPRTGTTCVEGTDVANAAYVQFQHGTTILPANYEILRLHIRSKAAWARKRSLKVQFFSAGSPVGNAITISNGAYGFDSSITAAYQFVGIPIVDFAIPATTTINQLRITDAGGALGCYIDDITLQAESAGIGDNTGNYLTEELANALYLKKSGDTATGDIVVPAEVYGAGWNGSNEVPTKNDVYDKIETVVAGAATEASNAEVWDGVVATKMLTPNRLYASAAEQALTDGVTITPDFNTGINFGVTLAGNRTLANPTNAKSGQSGLIHVTQDATGSRTLAYGTNWKFAGGAPTLSTAANAIDVISYFVRPSGLITASIAKALA